MADLICEGVCNPTLPTFDDVASFFAGNVLGVNAQRSKPEVVTLLEIVIAERKKLRHTEHRHVGGNRWACTDCGTERQYGAKDEAMPRWERRAS